MELDARIEALERELASIKGNLHATLEQIRDTLSNRQSSVSGSTASGEQAPTEDAPAQKKSDLPGATPKSPHMARKPVAERSGIPATGATRPMPGREHVTPISPYAQEEPQSSVDDLSSYMDRRLTDLAPDELGSILDMYVSMGYLPGHTKRLVTRILNPVETRNDRAGISLWNCITAMAIDDDAPME